MQTSPIRGAVARAKASRPQPAYKQRRNARECDRVAAKAMRLFLEGLANYTAVDPSLFPGVDIDAVHSMH